MPDECVKKQQPAEGSGGGGGEGGKVKREAAAEGRAFFMGLVGVSEERDKDMHREQCKLWASFEQKLVLLLQHTERKWTGMKIRRSSSSIGSSSTNNRRARRGEDVVDQAAMLKEMSKTMRTVQWIWQTFPRCALADQRTRRRQRDNNDNGNVGSNNNSDSERQTAKDDGDNLQMNSIHLCPLSLSFTLSIAFSISVFLTN